MDSMYQPVLDAAQGVTPFSGTDAYQASFNEPPITRSPPHHAVHSAPHDMTTPTHVSTSANVQAALKRIPESHKKWNEQFQSLLALPDSIDKFRALSELVDDFVATARLYGEILISEYLLSPNQLEEQDNSARKVWKFSVGGVAGGDKYVVKGIMFKIAQDKELAPGRWLYGGDRERADLAAKAIGHDLKGALQYANAASALARLKATENQTSLPEPPLRIPMQCVLEYHGIRLTAMPILPLKKLVYGSDNSGADVYTSNRTANKLMKEAGKLLHLAGHTVADRTLYAAGDVEVHEGEDGRLYLLDLSRSLPPEHPQATPHLRQDGTPVFYRLLRKEFLQMLKETGHPALSPDALSNWGTVDRSVHDENVRSATQVLVEQVIPAYAAVINGEEMPASAANLFLSKPNALKAPVAEQLHRHGINMRHMGLLRSLVTRKRARHLLAIEIISRSLKAILRAWLRKPVVDRGTDANSNNSTPVHAREYSTGSMGTVKPASASSSGSAQQSSMYFTAYNVPLNAAPVSSSGYDAFAELQAQDTSPTASAPSVRRFDSHRSIRSLHGHKTERLSVESATKARVAKFLNLVTGAGDEQAATTFWDHQVANSILLRFGALSFTQSERLNLRTLAAPMMKQILARLLEMTGVELTAWCAQDIAKAKLLDNIRFVAADIQYIREKVKYMSILDYAKGKLFLLEAQQLNGSRTQQRLFALAAIHLQGALRSDPFHVEAWIDHAVCQASLCEHEAKHQQADLIMLRIIEQVLDSSDYTYPVESIIHTLLDMWQRRADAGKYAHLGGAADVETLVSIMCNARMHHARAQDMAQQLALSQHTEHSHDMDNDEKKHGNTAGSITSPPTSPPHRLSIRSHSSSLHRRRMMGSSASPSTNPLLLQQRSDPTHGAHAGGGGSPVGTVSASSVTSAVRSESSGGVSVTTSMHSLAGQLEQQVVDSGALVRRCDALLDAYRARMRTAYKAIAMEVSHFDWSEHKDKVAVPKADAFALAHQQDAMEVLTAWQDERLDAAKPHDLSGHIDDLGDLTTPKMITRTKSIMANPLNARHVVERGKQLLAQELGYRELLAVNHTVSSALVAERKGLELLDRMCGAHLRVLGIEMHVESHEHFKAKTAYESYPPKVDVPKGFGSWRQQLPGYSPQDYSEPGVDTKYQSFDPKSGRPLNPHGRTGLKGRGCLYRWGPNQAGDPIVTRLNPNTEQFEMVAVMRRDTGVWSIPGCLQHQDEDVEELMKQRFQQKAVNLSAMSSADDRSRAKAVLQELFADRNRVEVYRGYIDDPRNTDNAWIESVAINFHCPPDLAKNFPLKCGAKDAEVGWIPVDKTDPRYSGLHASHRKLVDRAVEAVRARLSLPAAVSAPSPTVTAAATTPGQLPSALYSTVMRVGPEANSDAT